MRIEIERRWPKPTYTIGRLYVDGCYVCNTLEDRDRGLEKTQPLEYIKAHKVYAETAIPKGSYVVDMKTTSPKYAAVPWYRALCKGKMPRLKDVPGFSAILVHPGSTALDSSGCILVGRNTKKGRLTESKETFKKLYRLMEKAESKGEEILIDIY